jgi:hypothetical protein
MTGEYSELDGWIIMDSLGRGRSEDVEPECIRADELGETTEPEAIGPSGRLR